MGSCGALVPEKKHCKYAVAGVLPSSYGFTIANMKKKNMSVPTSVPNQGKLLNELQFQTQPCQS
jgi:hypothetical protein